MSKSITDKEIQNIINKKTSLNYIKNNQKEHYKVLQLGSILIKHDITNIEQLKTLLNIKETLSQAK